MAKEVVTDLFRGWNCRPYQVKAWDYLNGGGKRYVGVWHRRAGKDELLLRWSALSMIRRPATYWHMLPMKEQARTAIWSAINPHTGIRRIDEAFPSEVFEKNETDMMVKCKINAATWQVKGSDNFGGGIGSPPAGIVFSEYSRADPNAWSYLRPILLENDGWAAFISTPYGHNHFENLYRYSVSEDGRRDGWFGELLPYTATGVFSKKQIDAEEREISRERNSPEEARSLIGQEYECSFDSAIPGSIFGPTVAELERAVPPRVTVVPHDPNYQVFTGSDLGASEGNDMAIWWFQKVGHETRLIDCDSAVGVGIDWYAEKMNERARERKFVYAPVPCYLPHDAGHPQASNVGAASFARKLKADYGYASVVNPVTRDLWWSIIQMRAFLKTCVFDEKHCAHGLQALRHYHRKWIPERRTYQERPVHDWSSNLVDALRSIAEGNTRGMGTAVQGAGGVIHSPRVRARTAIDYENPLYGE